MLVIPEVAPTNVANVSTVVDEEASVARLELELEKKVRPEEAHLRAGLQQRRLASSGLATAAGQRRA
jgi:hypothetical protein